MNTTNRYHYDSPPRLTVFILLVYLGSSAWMAHLARRHEELGVGFLALSVIFATLALVVLVRRLAFPCTLELSDDAILLPRGHPWPRIATIRYADIISIEDGGDTLCIRTGPGSFEIVKFQLEDYPAVREIISSKTATKPLVEWVEPEDWTRFRIRAAISKPVLYQLRKELWFFVRCYAFCCALIIVPCLGFALLPWIFTLGPFQLVAISLRPFAAVSVLAIIFTMLHWLDKIYPVRPETKITFRDRGITARLPSGQQFVWNYREFCGWSVIERQFKARILEILLLKRLVKGLACKVAFALPDASVRDQVLQILNDRQMPQTPDLKPSWEAEESRRSP